MKGVMDARSRRKALLGMHRAGVSLLRRSGMAGLLVLLVFGMFVMPVVFPSSEDVTVAGRVVIVLIFVCGIVAISESPGMAVLVGVLAALVVLARVFERFAPSFNIASWHDAVLLAALGVLAIAVGTGVFATKRAIADRLFGAIALYLLLGIIWATLYALVATTIPNAFAGSLPSRATMFDWGYFSLVTLTTVGYGDITPAAHVAKSLATLEALVGQLYPAIIIARLVSA
jgi:hypothetical protein